MVTFGNLLRLLAIYFVYPVIVLSLFFSLGYLIYNLIKHGREREKLRRIAGALIPVVGLVFILVLSGKNNLVAVRLFDSLNGFGGFIFGLVVGAFMIVIGNYIKDSENEVLPSLNALFLSFIAVFVFYSITQFKLGELNYFILGIIIGGAAIIVWKGMPNDLLASKYNPWTVKGYERHQDIAREYLTQEVGLSAQETEYILANTSFLPVLTEGNFVFNHYVEGVYFSAVTKGNAKVEPRQKLPAYKNKQLDSSKAKVDDEISTFSGSNW